jgi:hypothetical protein
VFNGGSFRLLTAGAVEVAAPTFGSPAFGGATTANPAVLTANSLTADNSVTPGTFTNWEWRTSGGALRMSGSIGVGSGDIQVSDNVVTSAATSVNIAGLTWAVSVS